MENETTAWGQPVPEEAFKRGHGPGTGDRGFEPGPNVPPKIRAAPCPTALP